MTELKISMVLDAVEHDAPGPFLRLTIGGHYDFDLPADRIGKLIGVLEDMERQIKSAEMDKAARRVDLPTPPPVILLSAE